MVGAEFNGRGRRATARRVVAALVVATTVGGVAVACSSDDSGDSSTSSDRSVTTTTGRPKDFSVDTPEGTVSLSLDGQLPPDWPEDFPSPKQSEVAGSGSLVQSGSGTMVAVYTTKQSAKDAYDFYTGTSSLEPSDESSTGIGSSFVGSMKISGDQRGSVTVVGRDSTYIVVVLDVETSSSSDSTTTTGAGGSSSTTTSAPAGSTTG